MCKTVAEDLLWYFYGVSNDQHKVAHTICPWGKTTASIDDYILKGLKLSLGAFVCAKSSLIIDIIFEPVVSAYGFYYFVAVVDGFLEECFDVFVEIIESKFSFLIITMCVYEE